MLISAPNSVTFSARHDLQTMSNFSSPDALISMTLSASFANASVSRLDPAAHWLLGQVPESVLDRDQCLRN